MYDDQSVLLQTDPSGTVLTRYAYGPDRLIAQDHRTEGLKYYLTDALSSPVTLTSASGGVLARYQYDVWGVLRGQSGTSYNPFHFTGHELDDETGLYYAKARYYDPSLGLFLSEDPFEGRLPNPPSLHRYLYAFGNPTVYVDPDGRQNRSASEQLGFYWDVFTGTVSGTAEDAGQLAIGILDHASAGSISGLREGLAAYHSTDGTLYERLQAARRAGTRAQLNVITLGFLEAQDKLDHLKEITGINSVQRAGTLFGEAWEEGDWEKAVEGVGELGAGLAAGASTALTLRAGVGVAQGIARTRAAARTRARVEANIQNSAAARRSSNFRQYAQRDRVIQTDVRVRANVEASRRARASSHFAEHTQRARGALTTESAGGGVRALTGEGVRGARAVAPDRPTVGFYIRPNGDVIPATAFRHISSEAPYLKELVQSGRVPANQRGTYLFFDRLDCCNSAWETTGSPRCCY